MKKKTMWIETDRQTQRVRRKTCVRLTSELNYILRFGWSIEYCQHYRGVCVCGIIINDSWLTKSAISCSAKRNEANKHPTEMRCIVFARNILIEKENHLCLSFPITWLKDLVLRWSTIVKYSRTILLSY